MRSIVKEKNESKLNRIDIMRALTVEALKIGLFIYFYCKCFIIVQKKKKEKRPRGVKSISPVVLDSKTRRRFAMIKNHDYVVTFDLLVISWHPINN